MPTQREGCSALSLYPHRPAPRGWGGTAGPRRSCALPGVSARPPALPGPATAGPAVRRHAAAPEGEAVRATSACNPSAWRRPPLPALLRRKRRALPALLRRRRRAGPTLSRQVLVTCRRSAVGSVVESVVTTTRSQPSTPKGHTYKYRSESLLSLSTPHGKLYNQRERCH